MRKKRTGGNRGNREESQEISFFVFSVLSVASCWAFLLELQRITPHEIARGPQGANLRRRRRQGANAPALCESAHPGVHHQPDLDAQGRHPRLSSLCPGNLGSDSRSAYFL